MIPIAQRTWLIVLIVGLVTLGFAAAPAAAKEKNKGTIKVHDSEDADPDQRNEPHVSCDFYIEGFHMQASSGYLVFYDWPPTGDKDEVTPDGDDLEWKGTLEDDEETYHFLNGAYFLPPGHYRVEAWGDGEDKKEKSKMFWVDECEGSQDGECPDVDLTATAESDGDILLEWDADGAFNIYRAEGGGDREYIATEDDGDFTDTDTEVGVTYTYVITAFDTEDETETKPCARAKTTAVPFFPSMAVGALALLGSVGAYATLRRK